MNKQSLYLVGGALLATTALSTTANAVATLQVSSSGVGGVLTSATTTFVPFSVATQVFPTTTATAAAVTIGGGVATANNEIVIDTSPTFATFDVQLNISSNAAFSTTTPPTVALYVTSTVGTLAAVSASVTGCTVQPSGERISILACNVTNTARSRVDAIGVRGIVFTGAADLRTAGTNVTLSGGTFLQNSSTTIDAITPAVVLTSKSVSSDARVIAGSAISIDNNATNAFTLLVSSGVNTTTVASLGSVFFSSALARGTDLSNVFTTIASVSSALEVKISHAVLSDTSLANITFNSQAKSSPQFSGTTVTFTVASASLQSTPITVTFLGGTSTISEATSPASATVTPTVQTGSLALQAYPAFSGALATLTRGGLSVQLNTVLPSAMKSSYISFIRVVNQSSVASTATITVRNDATNALVGSYTTSSIAAGGTLEINSVGLDAALATGTGVTLLTTAYKVTVTGSFNGYVQNLLYNVSSQTFADASGFRNGSLTIDP